MRHLALLGIQQRNRSEAMYTRHSFLNYEDRKSLAAAAHASIRGKAQRQSTREKIALSKFWNQKVVSQYQVDVQAALWSLGVSTVREYPLGRFNMDLAECGSKTAVEIHGGKWHRYGKHWKRRQSRIETVVGMGWRIIEVWTAGDKYWDVEAVAAALVETIGIKGLPSHVRLGCDGAAARDLVSEGAENSVITVNDLRDKITGRYFRF